MKLENQDWERSCPGSLPDGAIYRFMDWARSIAAQARVRQDVFEDFKSHFAPQSYSRSSTEYDAEWDLHNLMDAAAQNAPVFIATFANACTDFK